MDKGYEIRAQGKSAEILIYEDIGGDPFFGGLSAKQFAEDLKALGKLETINLRINSSGGSVFEGLAIYNSIRRHSARVEVDIDGLAASIASVIAMAGDTVRIAENGFLMIHRAWGMVMGHADDMESMAGSLRKVDSAILDVYDARASASRDELQTMIDAETWFTASEALAAGLVDEVVGEVRVAAFAIHDLSRFRQPPEPIRDAKEARERRERGNQNVVRMAERLRARKL
jgi:ATP-dependent Clp protease, protease subunit